MNCHHYFDRFKITALHLSYVQTTWHCVDFIVNSTAFSTVKTATGFQAKFKVIHVQLTLNQRAITYKFIKPLSKCYFRIFFLIMEVISRKDESWPNASHCSIWTNDFSGMSFVRTLTVAYFFINLWMYGWMALFTLRTLVFILIMALWA